MAHMGFSRGPGLVRMMSDPPAAWSRPGTRTPAHRPRSRTSPRNLLAIGKETVSREKGLDSIM